MKKLIIAMAVCATSMLASAVINSQEGFEGETDWTTTGGTNATYAGNAPSVGAYDYPFANAGSKYLDVNADTEAPVASPSVSGSTYVDMWVQFEPRDDYEAEELDGAKLAVYLNSASNIVVLAGTDTNKCVTSKQVEPGTWHRLTVAQVTDGFNVFVDAEQLTYNDSGLFAAITEGSMSQVGFSGKGAIDNFVARTTDPFISSPAVKIEGEGYASIQDALDDAGASAIVDLQGDNTDAVTLAAGESLKLRLGVYSYNGTITLPEGYVLGTPTLVDGVTTYSQVEGVAKVMGDDNKWKWFGSFADAFTYARAQSYQPLMTFKVGSDFTPGISSDFAVWNLEFIATTEDPITINLANGNAKLVSTRIKFPTTATLNAVSGNVDSMSGGTLNVPSGVVLELASYATDGTSWNITGLSGSGTIKNDGKSMYYFLGNPGYNLPTRMRESSWCGTLELSGSNTWETEFNKFANANSKVRFNGLTTPLWGSGNDTVAIELVGDGLTISGEYQSARTYAVGGTITGSGALTLADNTGSLLLSGDTSGFTGSVTASGTSAVIFNSTASNTDSGNRIYVGTGKSATIGSSATWTATNLVLLGELTVNGTLAVNDNCISCTNGAGVLRYANKDTLPTSAKFAGSWNSKCIIACDPGNKRFVLNDFGNANSTLEIAGDNGVFSALPSTDNTVGTAPSINPAVILTANWTVSDGWAAADKVTTFSKLSGTGNLTVNGSALGTAAIYYTITELNDYTGTLGGNRGNFTISKVNVATAPADGARVVATAIGANGSINSDIPLWVGGSDSGDVLEYKADGANGAGLYVKASASSDVTFTFELGEGVLGVNWTAAGGPASSDLTGTAAPGTEITINSVTYSNEWYIAAGSVTNGAVLVAADTTFNVTAKKTADVDPETGDIVVTPTTVPSEVGITNGAFAEETAGSGKLSKVLTWATKSGKGGMSQTDAVAAINAMTFTEGSETRTEKAYLFNCADTQEAVDAAAAAFKFNTIDTASLPPVVSGADDVNGTVTVKGADDVNGPYGTESLPTKKFFKATLTK